MFLILGSSTSPKRLTVVSYLHSLGAGLPETSTECAIGMACPGLGRCSDTLNTALKRRAQLPFWGQGLRRPYTGP